MSNREKKIRAVAIVVKGDEVLVMRRVRGGKEYYNFPGGGVEDGETAEQAVLREVEEETSLEVGIERLLYRHIYDDGSEQFFYLCRYVAGKPVLGEGSREARDTKRADGNFYEPMWYKIDELLNLLLYPLEIRDWFIKDYKTGFNKEVKEAKIKVSELRRVLEDILN